MSFKPRLIREPRVVKATPTDSSRRPFKPESARCHCRFLRPEITTTRTATPSIHNPWIVASAASGPGHLPSRRCTCRGVSARSVTKIQNAMAHVPKMATAWMVPGTCGASSTPTSPLKRSAVSVRRSLATRKQLLIPASWLEDYYHGSPHGATNPGAPPPQTPHHTWTGTHQ